MSEYRRYSLTLTAVDSSARDRFRSLSRPESYFEIRPGQPGERVAYSVEMTRSEYEAALEDAQDPGSNLIAIEPVRYGYLPSVPGASVLAYAAAGEADSLGLTGRGVVVGVIDSGISSVVASSFFGGRIKAAKSFADSSDPYNDQLGHGTAMAPLAAPGESTIAFAKVAPAPGNTEGGPSDDTAAAGTYWLVDEVGVNIILFEMATLCSTVIRDMVNHAYSKNILLIGAAGNGGTDNTGAGTAQVMCPASLPEVLAITNYRPSTDSIAETSNWSGGMGEGGEGGIFAAAPGCEINVYEVSGSVVYKDSQGTSAASAMATGIAARFMTGGRSPGNVTSYLASNARPTGASPLYEGNGVLQLAAAEKELQQDKPQKTDLEGNPMEGSDGSTQDGVGNPDPGACG